MKDPAFPLYTQDFFIGTMLMTDEEVGVYIRLLIIQHQHGGLIDKQTFLSKTSNYPRVAEKFIMTDDGYYNERLMKEMVKREKKSNNLSANAKARWSKNANAMQKPCKSNAIASDLHSDLHMPIENEIENISLKEGVIGETKKPDEIPASEETAIRYFEMQYHQMLPPEFIETWRKYIDHLDASQFKIHEYNVGSHLKAFKECFQNGISPPELFEAFQQSNNQGLYWIKKRLIELKEQEDGKQNSKNSQYGNSNKFNGSGIKKAVGDFDITGDEEYHYETFEQK